MTQLNKKDIIEAMARNICIVENKNPDSPSHTTAWDEIQYTWGWYIPHAEAAFQAFLKMLPEGKALFNPISGDTAYKEEFESGYYCELLEMRKKDV